MGRKAKKKAESKMSLIDLPDSDKNAYTEDGVQQILFSPFP